MATNLLPAAECENATSNGAGVRKFHDGNGSYLWGSITRSCLQQLRLKKGITWTPEVQS